MKSLSLASLTRGLFFRLVMTDIGCFVLSLFSAAISQSKAVRAGTQAICIVALLCIIYSYCYNAGQADAPLTKSGNMKYSPFKGLVAGLIANIPCFVSGIALVIARFLSITNFTGYYKLINSFFAPLNNIILTSDMSLVEYSAADISVSLITMLVIPVFAWLSYYLGIQQFSFTEILFYRKKAS